MQRGRRRARRWSGCRRASSRRRMRDPRGRCAHQALAPRWPAPVGVVSGPSFAEEVARGLPTALAVAATDAALARRTSRRCCAATRCAPTRATTSPASRSGGAVKNVLAIAAGASDGLGFGHNARAALITRGLAETGRLVGRARRQARDADGPRGTRRPRAHLHRRPVAQPARRPRAGARPAAGGDPRRARSRRRGRARGARGAMRSRGTYGVEMPICDAVRSRAARERAACATRCSRCCAREPRAE